MYDYLICYLSFFATCGQKHSQEAHSSGLDDRWSLHRFHWWNCGWAERSWNANWRVATGDTHQRAEIVASDSIAWITHYQWKMFVKKLLLRHCTVKHLVKAWCLIMSLTLLCDLSAMHKDLFTSQLTPKILQNIDRATKITIIIVFDPRSKAGSP